MVLGIEPRALCILGRKSNTHLYSQTFYYLKTVDRFHSMAQADFELAMCASAFRTSSSDLD